MNRMKKAIISFLLICIGFTATSQSLVATGNLATARAKQESQVLNTGKVLTFGGYNGLDGLDRMFYKSSELYDPDTGTWGTAGEMSTTRTTFASAVLPDGNVIAIGGVESDTTDTLASCEIYNVGSDSWAPTGDMIVPRLGHRAVSLLDGRVLVVGGTSVQKSAEIFDPGAGTWTLAAEMKYHHGILPSLTLLEDGRVLCTGGRFASPDGRVSEIYDPGLDEWLETENMDVYRLGNNGIMLEDGDIFVYGGLTSKVCEIFDVETETFQVVASSAQLRPYSEGIKLTNGHVLVYGIGNIENPDNTKALEIYDPYLNVWNSPEMSNEGSRYYDMVALETGEVLIIGGLFNNVAGAKNKCYIVEGVISSVEELAKQTGIDIFPNPASNQITMAFDNTIFNGNLTIEIMDMTGRVIATKVANAFDQVIVEVENFKSGVYLCRVTDQQQVQSKSRFVVQ